MGEDKVMEEELLEADGDPDGRGERKGGEGDDPRGFPPPEALGKQWSEHVEKAGLKGKSGDEAFDAWVAFCKQQGYPHPYPYPYPRPNGGARAHDIVQLVDRLLGKLGTDEIDEVRRKLLTQIRALASGAAGAAHPNPSPAASKEEEGAGGGTGDVPVAGAGGPAGAETVPEGVEKAGRKISSARLTRLKKLLDELKSLIDEVESDARDEKKADGGASPADDPADAEGMLARIAKALGVAGAKEGESVPDLAGAVKDLKKRIDDLENTPGSRTSLDEQDDETGKGRKGKGKVWKGLL